MGHLQIVDEAGACFKKRQITEQKSEASLKVDMFQGN